MAKTNAQKRDELLATGLGTKDGKTVHWGKVTFTAAEWVDFKKNMLAIDFDEKSVATLQAVHDGKPVPGTEEITTKTTTQELLMKATFDDKGNMHIGKLEIDKGLVDDFNKAMQEGVPDQEFAAFIEKASTEGRHLIQDNGANSRASGKNVWWDSKHVASDYHNEASMSARDVLKHEFSHSMRDPKIQEVLLGIPDGVNTNREERAAIESEHRHMNPNQRQRHSHEANTVRTQDDVNEAPQYSARLELAMNVADVAADGTAGPTVYKNSGQIRGTVKSIEHKDGVETITITDARGKQQQISFSETTSAFATEDWRNHPMKSLTKDVKVGNDIAIVLDQSAHTATLQNRTQGVERVVDEQARTLSARNVDFSKVPAPAEAPHR